MLKKLTAAILSLALACLMGTSIAISTATPAAAMKTGQAVLACAANLKCHDSVLKESGEHVMCVTGGGCVVCPADGAKGNCIAALRPHEIPLTTDPGKILMSQSPAPAATPKKPVMSAFAADTGQMSMSGSGGGGTAPTKPVISHPRAPQPTGMSPN